MADLSAEIAARLEGDEYFSDIPIITDKTGDIETEINKALAPLTTKAGKCGAFVFVSPPVGIDGSLVDCPGSPTNTSVTVIAGVSPLINRGVDGTKKEVWDIANRAKKVLVLAHFVGCFGPLKLLSGPTPERDTGRGDLDLYTMSLGSFELTEIISKVQTPTFSPASGATPLAVTIACGTSGASIYYTLDGTPPTRKSAAYSTGINIDSACTLRACAFKAGHYASDTQLADYS